jgi:LysR family transcriptional activator of nhaA
MEAPMEWLNYNHLFYFWTVAREGSIAVASKTLGLTQPTISAQIRKFEDSLGRELFTRRGRGLVLTDTGRLVMGYADDIFAAGRELTNAVRQGGPERIERFTVGVVDAVPKVVSREILKPVIQMSPPVHLVVREGKLEPLVAELAMHRLDMVLADTRYTAPSAIKIYTHRLGETGVTFFAPPSLAETLKADFPRSLDGVPALLPADNTPLRGSLESWFESIGVRPRLLAEFEDTALLKEFGAETQAVFAVPSVAVDSVAVRHGAVIIGSAPECREAFFAISAERRLKHPALLAIRRVARDTIFQE